MHDRLTICAKRAASCAAIVACALLLNSCDESSSFVRIVVELPAETDTQNPVPPCPAPRTVHAKLPAVPDNYTAELNDKTTNGPHTGIPAGKDASSRGEFLVVPPGQNIAPEDFANTVSRYMQAREALDFSERVEELTLRPNCGGKGCPTYIYTQFVPFCVQLPAGTDIPAQQLDTTTTPPSVTFYIPNDYKKSPNLTLKPSIVQQFVNYTVAAQIMAASEKAYAKAVLADPVPLVIK